MSHGTCFCCSEESDELNEDDLCPNCIESDTPAQDADNPDDWWECQHCGCESGQHLDECHECGAPRGE